MQVTASVPDRQAFAIATRIRVCALIGALAVLSASGNAQVGVKGWGWQVFDSEWNSLPVPGLWAGLGDHTMALRPDGNLGVWGSNHNEALLLPPLPAGVAYVEACAGWEATAALRSDGTIVVVAGTDSIGLKNVPPLPPGLLYVEVDAGAYHLI